MIPSTYADWRRCIEHDCGLPLTRDFVAARLADLLDRTGGAAMMAIATTRPIRRENNVLVLG
jgi:hypothetical protein